MSGEWEACTKALPSAARISAFTLAAKDVGSKGSVFRYPSFADASSVVMRGENPLCSGIDSKPVCVRCRVFGRKSSAFPGATVAFFICPGGRA
jgi:hypothetical protein